MTREEAIDLMQQYSTHILQKQEQQAFTSSGRSTFPISPVLLDLIDMPHRFPEGGSEKKAMRWLGYMQGVLISHDVFTLEELKDHSRFKKITT